MRAINGAHLIAATRQSRSVGGELKSRSKSCDFTDDAPNILGFLANTDRTALLLIPAGVRMQDSATVHSGSVLPLRGALLL